MDFWESFFLLLIYIPAVLIWGFALVDIFRRDDMSGLSRALWVAIVLIIPFLGTLVYLLLRPAGATAQERAAIDRASREFVRRYESNDHATQLQTLADLHDRGKLTDAEFAAEKALLIGSRPDEPQPMRAQPAPGG